MSYKNVLMGLRLFIPLLLLTGICLKPIAQIGDKVLVNKYLVLQKATWQWIVSPIQRKRPTPSRPYKSYTIEFLVKKDCSISNPSANIGTKKVKGRVNYNNNLLDSFE